MKIFCNSGTSLRASQMLSVIDKYLVNLLAQIKAEQETVKVKLDKWNELIE